MSTTNNCAYCQSPITAETPAGTCPKCHTPHHTACWQKNSGCAVFGCATPVTPVDRPVNPAPPPRTTSNSDQVVPRNSKFAIGSFELSILAWILGGAFMNLLLVYIASLPAITIGIIALSKINNSQGQLKGKGFAIAGIVIGSVLTLFWPVIIWMRTQGMVGY